MKTFWLEDGTEIGIACPICRKSFGEYIHATEYASLVEMPKYCPNCGVYLGMQEGAEHEEKYRWHDLRKNPDDLPNVTNENDLYLVYEELGFAQYRTVRGWVFKDKFRKIDAWRYIEPFEEV